MAFENIVNQIEQNIENLKGIDIQSIGEANLPDWNELSVKDFQNSIDEVVQIIETSLEQSIFENLPFNIVNSAKSQLSKTVQLIQSFINQANQQNFHKAFQQLESYRTNLRNWGIYSYVNYEYNIEEKIKSFDNEYQDFLSKKHDIDELKKNVQQLIEPAVSGSLSKSFSDRKKEINKNTFIWLVISIVAALLAIFATVYVVNSLVSTFTIPESASPEQIQELINERPSYGLMNLIRLGILFPVYSFFLYAFNQYKKERNLEEEYAHRAAVATSLPNYGDLAVDPSVKDQIVSGASNVVFGSPIHHQSNNENSTEDMSIDKLQDLFDSMRKLINKQE
ncbi:MAG: hypothetical protein WD607_08210 [Candidatus Paceibacterota bacterium]